MLLSAQKCESQTVDGIFYLFISYFNIPIFEIFKELQNDLVIHLQKFICCLLKKSRASYVLRKLQNTFEVFVCSFFILFNKFIFFSETSRVTTTI